MKTIPLEIKSDEDKTTGLFRNTMSLAHNSGATELRIHFYRDCASGSYALMFYNSKKPKIQFERMSDKEKNHLKRIFGERYSPESFLKRQENLHPEIPANFAAGIIIPSSIGVGLENLLKYFYNINSLDETSAPKKITESGVNFTSTFSKIDRDIYQITIER